MGFLSLPVNSRHLVQTQSWRLGNPFGNHRPLHLGTQLNRLCLEVIQNSQLRYRETIYNLFFAPRFFLIVGRKCLKLCNAIVVWSFCSTWSLAKSPVSAGPFSWGREFNFSSPARLQIIGLPGNLDYKPLLAKPYYTCFKTGRLSPKLVSLIGPY